MFALLFVLLLEVQAKINPYGPTVVSDFTNCMSELIDQNFNEAGLLLFANTNNVSTSVVRIRAGLFNKIYSNLKYSVEVKTPLNHPPICTEEGENNENLDAIHVDQIFLANYIILVIDTYDDFTLVAARIRHSRIWNPHAKIIVLFFNFVNTEKTNEAIVEQILTCMFRHNAINIFVVVPQADNIRNALVYSWKAFDPPKYCGYFNESAHNRLRIENVCEHGHVKYHKNVFEGRVPDDMKGCVLYILALERQPFVSGDENDPNIERYFVNQLADIYGFRTEYIVVSESIRGERNESGYWDGALEQLTHKKGHILLGGIFPDWDVHEDFECSSTYLADAYTWVVPRALQSPKYIALFIIFKATVWYSAVAGFCLCGVTWKIIGQLSGESFYHRTFRHCFLNTWISNIGFCAYARPVKNSLRVFYVFFNIYCILFLTGYQTKLFDVLTNPTFEEQIDSTEELVNSGLKFGGFEMLHDLFFNSSDPFDFMLGEKWHDVENLTEALIDVALHRNFSVLCSRLELAHMSATMPELNEVSGYYKYHAFEQDMFTVPMEMVALKGFAYMKGFSQILEKFKQLGVNSGIRRYYAQLNTRKRADLLRAMAPEHPEIPLSTQHLQGGFFALTLGYLGGIISLIIEILVENEYVNSKFLGLKQYLKKSSK